MIPISPLMIYDNVMLMTIIDDNNLDSHNDQTNKNYNEIRTSSDSHNTHTTVNDNNRFKLYVV